jgi:hypothetical protein
MPSDSVGADPPFSVVTPERLARDHFLRLAAGDVAAVHLRDAVSATACARFAESLGSVHLTDYDVRRYRIPAARLGPSLNEANAGGTIAAEYWEKRDLTLKFWGDADENLRAACGRIVGDAWSGDVRPATVAGRELFWGILRELSSGTVLHCDDVRREYSPDLLDDPPQAQMGFNMFVSTPDIGGETLVWDRKWQPADENHRTGIGYSPEILNGQAHVTVKPRAGDVIIFDSRNIHAVRPGNSGRRISLSFFIGLTMESLILWS